MSGPTSGDVVALSEIATLRADVDRLRSELDALKDTVAKLVG